MALEWYYQAICTLNYRKIINATEMLLFRKKIQPYVDGLTVLRYSKTYRDIELHHNHFVTRVSLNNNRVKRTIRKMSV